MASSSPESAHQVVSDDEDQKPKENVVSDDQDQKPKEMIVQKVEEEETKKEEVVVGFRKPSYQPKRRWSLLEDAKLLLHVADNGPAMWKKISEKLQKRSSLACRVRWINYLQPGLRDGPFRNQEEMDLMVAHVRRNDISPRRNSDILKRCYFALKAIKLMRAGNLNPPATPPTTRLLSKGNIVSAMTSGAGSGIDLSRIASCRFNLNADVQGQRTSMGGCGVCSRVLELRARLFTNETYMASIGKMNKKPAVYPSVTVMNLNLTLATTVYPPEPPSPPAPPAPPQASPSSPPPSNFIDFLGVGSI